MDESILQSIKKLLGIAPDYPVYDLDILIHINSVINILWQLGVSTTENYVVIDKTNTWSEIIKDGTNLNMIKTFIYLHVRRLFDPPTSSIASESINNMIKELEFRINVMAESLN